METLLKIKNETPDKIYSILLDEYFKDEILFNHREYVEKNNLGYGEKPFHVIWREIVKSQNNNFKFLEIGVYKGQVLSLIKLLSNFFNKESIMYGVTPLNTLGDKYTKYDDIDYVNTIEALFNNFNLDFKKDETLIVGCSQDELIKNIIKSKGIFDVVYIDGCHNYDCVVSDIELMLEITKKDSIIVFDDASCFKVTNRENAFMGHLDVCNAIRDRIENNDTFDEIICVGHNRIFKRLK